MGAVLARTQYRLLKRGVGASGAEFRESAKLADIKIANYEAPV